MSLSHASAAFGSVKAVLAASHPPPPAVAADCGSLDAIVLEPSGDLSVFDCVVAVSSGDGCGGAIVLSGDDRAMLAMAGDGCVVLAMPRAGCVVNTNIQVAGPIPPNKRALHYGARTPVTKPGVRQTIT